MLTKEQRETSPEARVAPLKILGQAQVPSLLVHEIYESVQGESTWAGVPCVFIRTTGCHLRCTYCDTAHAFNDGVLRAVDDVVADVTSRGVPLVEVTGGEPLLQGATSALLTRLLDAGHTVLVETSGAVSIAGLDPRTRLIVDVKTPASGEHARHRWHDLPLLKPGLDELKFVIVDEADYVWAREQVLSRPIPRGVIVLFSPAATAGSSTSAFAAWLAERIVADRLPVRFQMQLHKVLWGDRRGV
jgi:7-carboxy-7-deazaguanine synthase